MTQTTAAAAVVPPPEFNSNGGEQRLPAAVINSYRVSNVVDRLASITRPGHFLDPIEFFNLCLSLSRGIDYAVANNEQLAKAHELPLLVKQICDRKPDVNLLGITMVLLISVKNCCKVGWFPEKETEEVLALANEMGRNFCSPIEIDSVTGSSHPIIATIMERFYPLTRMGHILTSLEIKPGYGVYSNDFHILKKTTCTPEDKIRLFVAQVDNMVTSACIISPQQVNFLINGKGVERRTNAFMDPGPQMPSNVTPLLKYGTNLLQAVGQFNGHYIIVIAFMGEASLCDTPVLPDYVQPLVDGSDSDADIIEGPSRISLNCPITYTRIKTPVKGRLCKHFQCFDFSNFVDMNTRRPSWRCPHCNQHVCYTDIRVDQNMVKVLKEVGDEVVDVIISTDGSWKAVFENDAHMDQARDADVGDPTSEQQESTTPSNALCSVVDLTGNENGMDTESACEIEDVKPSLANVSAPPLLNNTSGVNQNVLAVEDDHRSGHISPGLATPPRSDTQVFVGTSQSTPATFVQTPSISTAFNREADVHVNTNPTAPEIHDLSSLNNLLLQQMPFTNSVSINEYGRLQAIPRMVSRTPMAVQALPAQSQAPGALRLRPTLNSQSPNSTPVASQAGVSQTVSSFSASFNAIYSDLERQLHFSRSHRSPPQSTAVASSPPQQHLATQNQNQSFASPVANGYRSTSTLSGFHNAHLQQVFNPGMPQPVVRSPSHLSQTLVQQGNAQAGTAQASSGAAIQHTRIPHPIQRRAAVQAGRQSPLAATESQTSRQGPTLPANAVRVSTVDQRGNVGGVVQADSSADGSEEQQWRPAGRMRGSLLGRDYSHLRDLMIRPTQQAQPARPPPLPVSSPPPVVPNRLQVLLANNRNAHAQPPHDDSAP